MRLICPNCDAQYEVPDEVMPINGRDVQCSNCGQTWFQHHPDQEHDDVEDDTHTDADEEVIRVGDTEHEPVSDDTETSDWATEAETPEPLDDADEEDPGDDLDLSGIVPQRKELDPAVADILREEAEFERTLRDKEPAAPMESQPDLGLEDISRTEDADKRAREAADRMARMRGGDPDDSAEAAASAAALGSRRDLLPDIEEINSTLRSSNDRGSDDPSELANVEIREKRGFRRGFSLIILLVAVLVLLYVLAPSIISAVPALEGILTAYVGMIESMRGWLDIQMTSLLSWLDDAAAASANG